MAKHQLRAMLKSVHAMFHITMILCQTLTTLSKVEISKPDHDNKAKARTTIAQTDVTAIRDLSSLSIAPSLAIVPSAVKASVLSLSLHCRSLSNSRSSSPDAASFPRNLAYR